MKTKFRVFDKETHKDVTDERKWFIDSYGELRYLTDNKNKIGFPLAISNGEHYFELEILVMPD